MPIVFDEISTEVAPDRGAGAGEPAAAGAAHDALSLEIVMRELELARERAQRLIAD